MIDETTLRSRRGRPRDPAADRAILNAARSTLARKGFTGTSMDAIAKAAGVGKDTLYRRWNSKEELIRHLLTVIAEEAVPIPELEDPGLALFVFLQEIVRLNTRSDFGSVVAGLVGESARNPQLASGFHAFWKERRQVAAVLIRRIVRPDTDDAEIERLLDHILGPVYYRMLLTGGAIDDEYLWELVASLIGSHADSFDAGEPRM